MTDKQRITEILKAYTKKHNISASAVILEEYAEELLANGVIVPPVGIGDSLWSIHYNRPREWKVVYLGFNGEEWHINVHWQKDKEHYCTKQIDGKYVDRLFFRTKEEAEQALKEREKVCH